MCSLCMCVCECVAGAVVVASSRTYKCPALLGLLLLLLLLLDSSDWLATFVLRLSRQSKLYPLTARSAATAAAAAASDVAVDVVTKVKVKVNPSAKIQYFMH